MDFDFIFYGKGYCNICLEEKTEDIICKNCKDTLDYVGERTKLKYGECFYPYFYNNYMKSIIRRFKFEKSTYLSIPLAKLLIDEIEKKNLKYFDYITYIPMYYKDEFKRGYNQSKLLAKEISKHFGIPLISSVKKIKRSKEQNKLNKNDRKNNLKNCFKLIDGVDISGHLLIVDDLVTTGSTFNEFSKVIKENFDVSINYLVVASSHIGEDND